MFKFFRRHRSLVMIFLAACILGLILFGIGGTSFMSSPHDKIVKVNGQSITQSQFDRLYNQMVRQKNDSAPQQKQQLMGQVLNELIRQEVFSQEAQRYGIEVTDQELQYQLASIPAFQKEGKFDPQTYVRVVTQSLGMSPNDFEKNHKKDIAARKLNQLIASSIQIPDDVLEQAFQAEITKETDPKKKKELLEKPDAVRGAIRDGEINRVFSDWLNQLNSNLKVNIVSDRFQKMMNAPAAPAPQAPPPTN